jgi:hypothetical protein
MATALPSGQGTRILALEDFVRAGVSSLTQNLGRAQNKVALRSN